MHEGQDCLVPKQVIILESRCAQTCTIMYNCTRFVITGTSTIPLGTPKKAFAC